MIDRVRGPLVIVLALAVIAALRLITNDPPPSDARLVAVTAPPAAHRAAEGPETFVFRTRPYGIGRYEAVSRETAVSSPPVSGHVTAMDVRVVTPDGEVVPQHELMLHHVVFANGGTPGRSRTDAACPGTASGALLRHERRAAPADVAARLRVSRRRP